MPRWTVALRLMVEAGTADDALAEVREALGARLGPGWALRGATVAEARIRLVDLAVALGVSDGTIARRARALDIRTKHSGFSAEEAEAIRATIGRDPGLVTIAALAAELGVSIATIGKTARRAGIPPAYSRRGYTSAEAAAIRAARAEAAARVTAQALGAELGISRQRVIQRAQRLGFPGGHGYTPEQAVAIRADARRGVPLAGR